MAGLVINRSAASRLLRDESTLAIPLMIILLSEYGEDALEEDPLVIYSRVTEDFNAVMPEALENRYQAALTVFEGLAAWDPLALRSVALALTEGDLGDLASGVLEDVEPWQVQWALLEMDLLSGENMKLSKQAAAFVAEIIREEAEDLEDDGESPTSAMIAEFKDRLEAQLASLGVDLPA